MVSVFGLNSLRGCKQLVLAAVKKKKKKKKTQQHSSAILHHGSSSEILKGLLVVHWVFGVPKAPCVVKSEANSWGLTNRSLGAHHVLINSA